MAIKLITITPHYMGAAAERAVMDPLPDCVGAEFFESDTGLTYVFCGVTDGETPEAVWTLKLYPATAPESGA